MNEKTFSSVSSLPPGYEKTFSINIRQDKRISLILNGVSIALLVLAGWFLLEFVPTPSVMEGKITLLHLAIFLLSLIIMIILHEGIHALFFWLFSKKPVKFGFLSSGLAFYAACPGQYFSRSAYMVIALSPLLIICALAFIGMSVLPPGLLFALMCIFVLNFAGASGDLYYAFRIILAPKHSYALDTEDGMQIFSPAN